MSVTSNPLTLLGTDEFLNAAREWIVNNTPEDLPHIEPLCKLTQWLEDSAFTFFASGSDPFDLAYGRNAYVFLLGYAAAKLEIEQ